MPQAFGRFGEDNPVLDCVCKLCNDRLGRELEQSFAYSSIEGVHRFVAGLRPAQKFRPHQASDIGGILINEGPLSGCVADFRVSADGATVLMVPRPQVGFGKTPDGPFQWYPPDCLPAREQLQKVFGPTPPFVQWVGTVDDAKIVAELAARCTLVGGDVHERHVPDGVAQADVLGTITKKHTRTIAKIAFNYLAFTNLGLAYLPELHDVRQFVLHGTPDWSPLRQVVPCPPNSEWRLKCHAVSVQCRGQTIVSTVITLGILKYTLVLNSLLLLIPGDFGSLHVFDIPTGKVKHRKI